MKESHITTNRGGHVEGGSVTNENKKKGKTKKSGPGKEEK